MHFDIKIYVCIFLKTDEKKIYNIFNVGWNKNFISFDKLKTEKKRKLRKEKPRKKIQDKTKFSDICDIFFVSRLSCYVAAKKKYFSKKFNIFFRENFEIKIYIKNVLIFY